MNEPPALQRRGREQRRAARQEGRPGKSAYIRRRIPVVELLGDEAIATIEHNADTILEEIGMEFRRSPEALALWRAAGADVQGERVRIPRGLARALIRQAPARFHHHARNPARSVEIGADAMVFAPMAGAPFVTDRERGRRYGTLEDMCNFVRLAHMAPAIHHGGFQVCEPVDVPVTKRHLDYMYAQFRYTDLPFFGALGRPANCVDAIAMAQIVFGADFVDHNVVLLANININSPLVFDDTMLSLLEIYAHHGQGVLIVPAVLAGAMGPVTAAGCIAQLLAENLAGLAHVQLVRPGTPVVFGGFVGSVAMQTGAPTFGTPEAAHTLFAIAQLARRLGVPMRIGGALCASKAPDAQAASESMQSLFATVLAGTNLVMHGAGWLEGGLVASYEKFVLDADQLAMMQMFARGLDLGEGAQALEAFREVGPGGHFLGCAHTQANYRHAFHESRIADYSAFEQWQAQGELRADERATPLWQRMLADYEAPPIDPALDEALRDFVARRKVEIPDLPE